MCLAASVSAASIAQTNKAEVDRSNQREIIIRKNSDKVEKTTIVIDGDNITINGKPMDEFKSRDLTIMRRSSPGQLTIAAPRLRAATAPRAFQMYGGSDAMGGNKALLGVVTEKVNEGAKVVTVSKESAAEKAGLKKDDIITKIGDAKVEDPSDLSEAVGKMKPNDKVSVTYKRGNRENKANVTLGENKNRSFQLQF